jgi:general secretion pathway protein I
MNTRAVQGFTLIEMVIAFAILGVTLAVLYGSFENAMMRTRHDTRLSEATLLAQSLLSRAGSEWPLIDVTRHGKSNAYSFALIQQTLTAPEGEPAYSVPTIRVTASVNWAEGQARRSISLSSLKLSSPVQ